MSTMTYDFKTFEGKLAATRDWLGKEYRGLRTGRASPAILDGIMVSAYGSMMPLKQVATVGVEDARTLRVQPFDASVLKDIERAIAGGNIGVGTNSDGSMVRVSFPELSVERREELVKIAKRKLEEARATLRVARDDVKKDIETKERAGELSKDDKFRLGEELQKKIDKANEDLEKAFEDKQTEMSA